MEMIKITKRRIGFSSQIELWACKITDDNGNVYTGQSWDNAKGAYRLASMRMRVSKHSPAIYRGTTCVHLCDVSPRIARIVIYGKERVVYHNNMLDVGYDLNCYVHNAYGGYN